MPGKAIERRSKKIVPHLIYKKIITQYVWVIWLLLLIALIVGIGCGISGFMAASNLADSETGNVEVSDAVYATIKLLKIGDHSNYPAPNVYVKIARFLLPAVISIVAILGFLTILRRGYHRLQSYRFKNHTIVCGLGNRGNAYLKDAVTRYTSNERKKLDIFVIEKDPNNPGIKFCQDAGIPVFIGDATDESILLLTKPYQAKEIFSFLPEDGQNIALANTIAKIYLDKVRRSDNFAKRPALKCYLSISDLSLQNQFIDHEFKFRDGNKKTDLPIDIDFCYSHEYLAEKSIMKGVRTLIIKGLEGDRFDLSSTPEIALLGSGYIGRKIIGNLARIFHLSNEVAIDEKGTVEYHTPLILRIFDKDESIIEKLYHEYPILDDRTLMPFSGKMEQQNLRNHLGVKVAPPLPLPSIEYNCADFGNPNEIARIARLLYSKTKVNDIIVALGNDSLSISAALELERLFTTYSSQKIDERKIMPKIYVYYEKYGGFDTIFGEGNESYLLLESLPTEHELGKAGEKTQVSPLCKWNSISYDKDLANNLVDQVAICHELCYNIVSSDAFDETKQKIVITEDAYAKAKASFENRPVIQINQNRSQVYHDQVKLNLLGYSILRKDRKLPEKFTYLNDWTEIKLALHKHADILSRLEHQRWWAEQLLGGAYYNKERNNALEQHPDMVPFEYIHDVQKDMPRNKVVPYHDLSRKQKYDYQALDNMIISFEYAGYQPIKKISNDSKDTRNL